MSIQWNTHQPKVNENAKKPALELVSDFTGTDLGVFRILYVIEKTMKVASYVLKSFGNSLSVLFDAFARKCATAWQMLIIPNLPGLTKSALESVDKFNKDKTGDKRYALDMVANVTDTAGGYCLAASAVLGAVEKTPGSEYLMNLADGLDVNCKGAKLAMTVDDLVAARAAAAAVKGDPILADVHQNFVETQKYQVVKLLETSAGLATGTIGLAALIFGGPALPAIVGTSISLGRAIASISNHFYKETRMHKIVNMHDARMSLVTI